jgi:two-component system, LytTR family, response regulator
MSDSRLRALIADDEPLARDCVRLALRHHPDVEVVAESGDGGTAVAAIEEHTPDLVFLDIQMPVLDGFEVVEQVGIDRMPPTVFVTAYDQHALRAFRLHAVDYLLKPFDDELFGQMLLHARRQVGRTRDGELARRLEALLSTRTFASRVMVRNGDRTEFIPVSDIRWIETAGNYVKVHAGARVELVRITLASLLQRLDPALFARIHRSTVVNLSHIREIHPWYGGDYTAVLAEGQELRVSRSYRDALLRTVS